FLKLSGSTTLGNDLAPALAEEFLKSKGATDVKRAVGTKPGSWTISGKLAGKERTIEIDARGTSTGLTDLVTGDSDLAMASRRATTEEAQVASESGITELLSPSREHVVALDGIAIVVDRRSNVQSMTTLDLAKIFAGESTAWVGASGGNVLLATREETSG